MVAALFRLPRPRNPLLRVLSVLLAVVAAAATLFFGAVLVVALVAVGAVLWATRQFARPTPVAASSDTAEPAGRTHSASPPPPPGIIEGEFVVVREPVEPRR